ncbi:hypothetical protein [Methanoculleus chikugoensis]|uniref:hypothetical protein n=1 Tax=Methanoculleus chikugoensis TaxID=118126 RepID=UPI000A6E9531|nr:hypothetical protein [Methanoculleus chikugoensis]
MSGRKYVHGYTEREAERLSDQGETLAGLLHDDTRYPAGSRVLEAGVRHRRPDGDPGPEQPGCADHVGRYLSNLA